MRKKLKKKKCVSNYSVHNIFDPLGPNSFAFSAQVINSDRPEGSKFRISGKGVDQDPKGAFKINENTGEVLVTRGLDREAIANYEVSRLKIVPYIPFAVCLFLYFWRAAFFGTATDMIILSLLPFSYFCQTCK